tara:strand:- start:370 stop:1008 length:639 start_codon:yes stop_codon:yes gene_type:complete
MNITFLTPMNQKLTFVHIPKNAGKSINAYIYQHGISPSSIHLTSHATIEELKSSQIDLGLTFAVVRNPFTRAVSLYRYLFEVEMKKLYKESLEMFPNKNPNFEWYDNFRQEYGFLTFQQFCEQLPWMPMGNPQYKFIPVDIILRYETLNEDFKQIQNLLRTPSNPLFKINSTGECNVTTYYKNNNCAELIAAAYKNDFKLLGYSTDINNISS